MAASDSQKEGACPPFFSSNETWLLSGLPRSGSSLCCRLADGLPNAVALSEPLDFNALAGIRKAACAQIRDFAARTRARLLTEGRAPSVQVDGRLDDNLVAPARSGTALRQPRGALSEVEAQGPLSEGFTLLIKHNALFAALLPDLTPSFSCLALVRNPLATLASWQTVDLPVQRGRIPAGERFDRHLACRLAQEPDILQRQLKVLNWFFAQYRAQLPSHRILRYEDLIASGGLTLLRQLGRRDARTLALSSRNCNPLYRQAEPDRLLAALLREGGDWRHFYSEADCIALAAGIRRAR